MPIDQQLLPPAGPPAHPTDLAPVSCPPDLEPHTAPPEPVKDLASEAPVPDTGKPLPPSDLFRVFGENALQLTGFDPRTGQIVDPIRFLKWKQGNPASSSAAGSPTNPPSREAFSQARIALANWVDRESHCSLILRGDAEEVLRDPEVIALLQGYAGYGPVFLEKLVHHLAFLVEKRRKFYSARRG
jgi:hypothetical protein